MFRRAEVIIYTLLVLKAGQSYSIIGPVIHTRFLPPSFTQRSDALSSSLISFVIAKVSRGG